MNPENSTSKTSFIDQAKTASLHVLARHKKPKAPPKKGATRDRGGPRGDFTTEVIELVKAAYGVDDLTPAKFKPMTKKHGGERTVTKSTNSNLDTKEVLIYLYG